MKLTSVVEAALGYLCLLLADGLPVSQDAAPKIIGPHNVKIKTHPGKRLLLQCKAIANGKDETVIYWLVNHSFPEDLLSSSRIVESEESTSGDGAILKRSLLLKNVTSEDYKSTFTCVVTNAAGISQKTIRLAKVRAARGCDVGKEKKH